MKIIDKAGSIESCISLDVICRFFLMINVLHHMWWKRFGGFCTKFGFSLSTHFYSLPRDCKKYKRKIALAWTSNCQKLNWNLPDRSSLILRRVDKFQVSQTVFILLQSVTFFLRASPSASRQALNKTREHGRQVLSYATKLNSKRVCLNATSNPTNLRRVRKFVAYRTLSAEENILSALHLLPINTPEESEYILPASSPSLGCEDQTDPSTESHRK